MGSSAHFLLDEKFFYMKSLMENQKILLFHYLNFFFVIKLWLQILFYLGFGHLLSFLKKYFFLFLD